MATSARPTQATFWRRRLVALAALLLLLMALVGLVRGGGEEQPASRYTPPADSAPALPSGGLSQTEDGPADRREREAVAEGGSSASPQGTSPGAPQGAAGAGTDGAGGDAAAQTAEPPPRQGAGPDRETGGVGSGIDPRETGGTPAQ